jgi:hypothetical protein
MNQASEGPIEASEKANAGATGYSQLKVFDA